jgi:hypothetical protein
MTNSELQTYRLQLLALQNRINTDVSDSVVKGWWRSSRSVQDPWFTFRFDDDRLIRRFYVEGVPAGQLVSVFKVDPITGEWLGLLATGTVEQDGWVDTADPIIVKAGDAFIAVPEG